MRKFLKYLLILSCFCICFHNNVYAKEGIEFINIDVYIDEDGDADITETWKCEAYSGTEWYHPYYNLGNAKISDLSVSENGKEYTLLSSWNTSASQSYKTEKCGINIISNGIEICWGMGNYGVHEYKVNYTIENFVDQLIDSQMIYWTLIPHNRSDKVETASIKIRSYKEFNDDVLVWGFGEEGGVCRVNDGYIEMNSNRGLKKSEYMTILIKLPIDFFNSNNKNSNDFDYYYEMAIEGTALDETSFADKLLQNEVIFFTIIFCIVFCGRFFIITLISAAFKGFEKITEKTNLAFFVIISLLVLFLSEFSEFSRIVLIALLAIGAIANAVIKERKIVKGKIRESDVEYYRDIPCNKDIFKAYYIAYQYGILKNETDLLGAVILKWIKEKKASVVDKDSDSESDSIQLMNEYYYSNWSNPYEKQLYRMMYEASGDGILEKKELKKWCRNKYSNLFTWFDSVMAYEQSELIESGELIIEKVKKKTKYRATEKMIDEAKKICGLKKYLKDYSLIHEREPIEVHIFEEYLIMAQMLGIAKKVMKQFKELYPNVIEQSSFGYYDYVFVRSISHASIRSATRTRSMANAARGGGGSSFSGGGGGSRGGGSGGGGRR